MPTTIKVATGSRVKSEALLISMIKARDPFQGAIQAITWGAERPIK